ncbi:MAG: hypothetical protein WEA84_14140 [Rhodovibrionaceae bacterium]
MLYFLFFWIIPALVLYVVFYKYGHVLARRVGRAWTNRIFLGACVTMVIFLIYVTYIRGV